MLKNKRKRQEKTKIGSMAGTGKLSNSWKQKKAKKEYCGKWSQWTAFKFMHYNSTCTGHCLLSEVLEGGGTVRDRWFWAASFFLKNV